MAEGIFVIAPLGELSLPVLVVLALPVALGYSAYSHARTGPRAGWTKTFGGRWTPSRSGLGGGPTIQSLGAGALLTVLASTMMSESYEEGAPWRG